MRIVILAAMLLLATTVFITAAPSADAFGTCTVLSGSALQPGPHCPGVACIGTSWSYGDYYYHCQYEIGYPCQYCEPI